MCMCGWEEFIDQGIQEGFVAILKEGYGFISKYFPTEKHPTGIFFHKSDLRGSLITQLKVGDRVHFVVGQNSKGGCVAKKIEVQGQHQFAPQSNSLTPPLRDPSVFYGAPQRMMLPPRLGQYFHLKTSQTFSARPRRYPMGKQSSRQDDAPWETARRK
ncbi:PREDICTED: uncharacterized protein LOC107354178 [Acropora digitifera]|uniref:uncharacterized protein LOC107354178 n=1 Tax=Acropora digitifera TaxID=70779 RepID=UPI00077A54F1|nr:PREDICTED: uncharacterized protein LOC107354178 [Acropora digitifera]